MKDFKQESDMNGFAFTKKTIALHIKDHKWEN